MTNRAVIEVDRRIRELETKLQNLRKLREIGAGDAGLGEEILSFGGATASAPRSEKPDAPNGKVVYPLLDQVVAFFRANKNAWQRVRDIAAGTGYSKNAINGLMYTSKHKVLFETELRGPKERVFKLKVVEGESEADEIET